MANVCDQHLYIVSASEGDAKELLSAMAGNLEKATGVNALEGIDGAAGWDVLVDALSDALGDFNGLCLLSEAPDADAESGWLCGMIADGRPCVTLNMCLKWGPSFQVAEFCAGLDAERYGFASINGGEYVCAMGDEEAFIQWGDQMDVPFEGAVDYEGFVEWKESVLASDPVTLHDVALRHLFRMEIEGVFFWDSSDDDEWEDED